MVTSISRLVGRGWGELRGRHLSKFRFRTFDSELLFSKLLDDLVNNQLRGITVKTIKGRKRHVLCGAYGWFGYGCGPGCGWAMFGYIPGGLPYDGGGLPNLSAILVLRLMRRGTGGGEAERDGEGWSEEERRRW